MKTKLRADKMIFWNNLIPKLVLSYSGAAQDPGLGPTEPEPRPEAVAFDSELMFWILAACSAVLVLVFFPLLFKVCRIQQQMTSEFEMQKSDQAAVKS